MAFVEEVFKNKGKLYGGHTGKEYKKEDTEDIGGILWSRPCHYAPNSIVLEIEDEDYEEPHTDIETRGKVDKA